MSSSMEPLFMQIFDRKHWIEEQFRHQVESYGQSRASNLLAEGHRPPPWLWTSGSDDLGWPNPKELNREQLISEILDPFPQVTTPANNSSLFILPTLKGKNVNLFSSNFFTNKCTSKGYFEVKASDELVANDVPEGSKRNFETMAEPKVTENYSNLRQPTRTQTSTSKHTEPDMPPSKRAKTIKHPVEENKLHEFTGRVATCLNHDSVKDTINDTCTKYKGQKFHSVDKSPKLVKPQNDVLSVPSASSESRSLTSSAVKKVYLDAGYTAETGCQITNSISSRLSAISLSDPAHCYDGIEGYPNENSISGSEVENHASTSVSLLKLEAANILSCPESSASRQLSEDVLHALGTTRRIEAVDGDSTEVPFKEMPEVENLECDFHLTCNDCKSSGMTNHLSSNEETCQTSKNSPVSLLLISDCKLNTTSNHLKELQVDDSRESAIGSLRQCTPEKHCSGKMIEFLEPDPDIFISNDKCDLNKNSINAIVKESQNGLEASCIKNSALTDKLVSGGSKSTHNTSRRQKIMQIMQGGVTYAVDTVIHRKEIQRVSNGGPEEGSELARGNSECITHPASYAKGGSIFENALSNSSPEKDCLLNFCMDSSGHTSELSDISRKSTFINLVQHTEDDDCYAKPKEVLIDFELAKKSKDTYPVETVHLPLRRIEECDSNRNLAADLDIANRVSDDGQAERSDIIGTDDWGCNSYLPVCNVNASLPAISSSKENATACSSTDTGNMLNSMRSLSVQPNLMQDNAERLSEISTQYTDGEKCMEETEIEITGISLKQSDCVQFDGPILYLSETNEAHMGVQETDNSTEEITQRNIAKFVGSPDASQCQNAMLEGKRDTEEIDSVNDRITPDDKKMCDAVPKSRYFLRSSSSHDKHYYSLESSRIDYSNNSKQVDHACDITWPKRKKLKGRSNNVLATSPRLRVETYKHIEQKIDRSCRTSLNNTSGSGNGVPPFMLSHEMEVELSEAALGQSEEEHLSMKCRMMEGDYDVTGKCQGIRTPLSIKHIDGLYLDLAAENSSEVTESIAHNLEQYYVLQGRQDSLVTFEHRSPSKFGSFDESTDMRKMHVGEGISCVEDSTVLSKQYNKDLDGIQKTMPEFEGFSISVSPEGFSISVPPIVEDEVIFNDSEIPSLSKERASLLEKLCGSESILAAKSCASSKYNIDKIPDAYHSLPADIMEQLNLNGTDLGQYRTTKDDEITDHFCSLGLGSKFDGTLLRSHLYRLPPSNSKYAREAGKPPLTPPVEKLQQRMISRKSVASSEELGSNPELVCFRIDENSSTTGEESTSEHSRGVQISTNRIALADMTSVYQNMPTSVSACRREHLERGSLDSTNTVLPSEINCKENDNISVSTVQSDANSFRSRFSKPDISGKANERNRVRSVSEKWGKPNNIVSNISSFMPLVREKQQTAAPGIGGKRDIKVKALEAAEAAKHLEEKRQYEREMKKASAKLERVRLEQENVRQLELKQKQKEESRKKKEEDLEARKRQREADRIEKGRKRQCTEKARKQQRVHVERLHIEKGIIEKGNKGCRDKNANEKKRKGKELPKEAKKQPQVAKERKVAACRNTEEVEPSISNVVSGDSRHISCSMEAHGAYLKTNDSDERVNNPYELQTAIQDRMSVTTESVDFLSYEISPYKDSDDEDGDEDHIRKKKCFPSWARRESLDQILLSTCHLDPDEIFSRKSSFDLNKVLLPQVHRRLPPS